MPELPTGVESQTQPLVTRWQRVQNFLSNLALLFAILGGVGIAGGGVIFLWVEELRQTSLAVMGAGAILLVVAVLSSFPTVYAAVTGKKGRYVTTALFTLAAFTSIVVLLNVISLQNVQRFDLTFTQQFTLSPRAITILETLPEPVRVTGFFTPQRRDQELLRQQADNLLFEFQQRSGRKVTYRFVDPESEPSIARRYGITRYPVMIFEGLDSGRQFSLSLPPVSEQDLISSLLIVTGEKQKKIYFLTGHNERDLINSDQTSTEGYGFAFRGILADNYDVQALNLGESQFNGKIPEDAAVLIIAGARGELLTDEMIEVREWLKKGGRALFLVDPSPPLTIAAILEKWGVIIGKETIVDPNASITGDPRTPLLQRPSYLGDPITENLDVTFFPQATPVEILEEFQEDPRKVPPWIQYIPLAQSSNNSWGTLDPERDKFSSAEDNPGPLLIGLAVQALGTVEESRQSVESSESSEVTTFIVLGDSDFASNRFYSAYSNSDLFLNSVNWLAKDYSLISIRPKPYAFRELVVLPYEFDIIRYSSWFILPLVVALLGLLTWWRRR